MAFSTFLIAISLLGAQDSTPRASILMTDGDHLCAPVTLVPFTVKTPMGELAIRLELIDSYTVSDGKASFVLRGVGRIEAAWPQETIELSTVSGVLRVPVAKIRRFSSSAAYRPMWDGSVLPADASAPPRPTTEAAPSAMRGRAYRAASEPNSRRTWEDAQAGPGGTLLYLDRAAGEFLIIPPGEAPIVRLKTENGPWSFFVRAGKAYVVNRVTASVSIVDLASRSIAGRIAIGAEPICCAGPTGAPVLYVGCKDGIRIIDLDKNKDLGPATLAQVNQPLRGEARAIGVTPDNQYLYWLSNADQVPSGLITFRIDGRSLSYRGTTYAGQDGQLFVDADADRVYQGDAIRSLTLRWSAGTVGAMNLIPHAERGLVFGVFKPGAYASGVVRAFDAATLVRLGEIDVKSIVQAVVPQGDTLHVFTDKEIVAVALRDLVGEEAAALPKLRVTRDPADLPKLLAEGQALARDRKFDAALKKYAAALLLRPAKAEGLLPLYEALAAAHVELGNTNEAAFWCNQGWYIDSKAASVYMRAAIVHMAAGNVTRAVSAWRQALKLNASDATAKRELAAAQERLRLESTTRCPSCDGRGKFEWTYQSGGATKNVTQKCKTCQGAAKVWIDGCPTCAGSGRVANDNTCSTCKGAGELWVPDKK